MANPLQKIINDTSIRDVNHAVFNNSRDLFNYTKDELDEILSFIFDDALNKPNGVLNAVMQWPRRIARADKDRQILTELAPEFGQVNRANFGNFLDMRANHLPSEAGNVSTLDEILAPLLDVPSNDWDSVNSPFQLRTRSPNSFMLQGLDDLEDELADTFLYHRNKIGNVGDYRIDHKSHASSPNDYSPYDESPAMYASGNLSLNPITYGSNIHPMLAPKDFSVINQLSKTDMENFFTGVDGGGGVDLPHPIFAEPGENRISSADEFFDKIISSEDYGYGGKMPNYHITDKLAAEASGWGAYDAIYGAESYAGRYDKGLPQGDILAIMNPKSVFQPFGGMETRFSDKVNSARNFDMNDLARRIVPTENTEYAASAFRDMLNKYRKK